MEYDTECTGRFGKKFHLNMVDNFEGKKSTKEIVSEVAAAEKADVLVVGFHGRKGPKEDPTIFGSAVHHLALNPVSPVLIVKDKHTRPKDKDFTWLICTDGSDASFKAFNQAVKLLDKSRDSVVGLYVKQEGGDSAKVGQTFDEKMKEAGVNGTFIAIDRNPPEKPNWVSILTYLKDEKSPDVDFIAIANHGADFSSHQEAKYIGSTASGVIGNAKLNVFFVI